jgi:hypothetical protein
VKLWHRFTYWLEKGDLVPFLVIASAYHYVVVLWQHDPWWVAVPIGILVDLGHYRTVIIAARYRVKGGKPSTFVLRWSVAGILTAVSLMYHWRFYGGDFWLAVPIPVLIAALAYFQRHGLGGNSHDDAKGDQVVQPPATDDASDDQVMTKVDQAMTILASGETDLDEIMRQVNCSRSTVTRAMQKMKKEVQA